VKLSWWQKLLKLIGLYKAPQQSGRSFGSQDPKPAVRSNTRVATTTGTDGGSQYQREPREPREAREPTRTEVDSPRLYVGNLSYDATESDLEELFKGVGTVRNIEVIYNRNTHRSKGYAFIEMIHLDEAKRAVEVLHDQPFMGRKLLVSGAKSKEASDDEASRSSEQSEQTDG
jgi:RNA recognition motif-containing protein